MKTAFPGLLLCALLAYAAAFEVTSVRISHADTNVDRESFNGGLVRMSNVTLRQCIRYAYGISEPQIVGVPSSIGSLRFDIVGKAGHPVNGDELLTMLQPLLADRFHLSLHHETRTLPGYALTAENGGIHAAVSDPGTRFSGSSTRGSMKVAACTMSVLAIRLSAVLGRPVADVTHDPRNFDFTLQWTPDDMQTSGAPADSDSVSLFTALREQVGVRLESRKVPVDVLVVDHVELPSEN